METETDTLIDDMDFHVEPWGARMQTRIRNALQRHGIMTLGQLMCIDRDDLPAGLSVVSTFIINKKLEAIGLKLPSRRGM
jgi:hypothetical protein